MLTTFPDEETIVRRLSQGWWPVARVEELEERPLEGHRVTLLDRSLVVYRGESGKFYAADDRCPHRGASLALGRVSSDAIACPYHGWEWEGASGRCSRIPALGAEQSRIPASAQLNTYPTLVQWGLVWTCLDDTSQEQVPDPPELRGGDWAIGTRVTEQDTNILFSMENFRDVAHFPFVHAETFGVPPETPVEPLDVRREGREVFLRRRMVDYGMDPKAFPDWAETVTYHAYAPGVVMICTTSVDVGRTIANIHCVSPVSLESSRAFRVLVVSKELGHELEGMMRGEDVVYAEDGVIAGSITPHRLGAPLDQVHTLADAYTLAFRAAFLDWLSPG